MKLVRNAIYYTGSESAHVAQGVLVPALRPRLGDRPLHLVVSVVVHLRGFSAMASILVDTNINYHPANINYICL